MQHRVSRRELARSLIAPTRLRRGSAARAAPPTTSVPFEYHLLSRATFGRNEEVLADLQRLGIEGWLSQQLEPDAIDDPVERELDNVIAPYATAAADVRLLVRAIYSRRQLAWRMTHFLNNHFDTYRPSTQPISETREDELFYRDCFGDFATVLRTSATSPAMIDFLDSRSNVAGRPNENYARELMELHTLGVNGGYTEHDVAEAARVFTGWSRVNLQAGGSGTPVTSSQFQFRSGSHDSGPKSLSLGWSTPGISGANGYLEGYDLLDFLARHPMTATRFTEKLCRYFVADAPPASLLANVRSEFVRSGGSLRATVKAVFLDPAFGHPLLRRDKVHDGFELIANVARRLEIAGASPTSLNNKVAVLGGQPHDNNVPTGYPEDGPSWQGVGNLLPRWTFADDLVQNRVSSVRVPWTTLYAQGLPANAAAWVDGLLARLCDDDVPLTTRATLTAFMTQRLAALPPTPTLTQVLPHLRDLTSLVLRLPEAQLS